MTAPQYLTIPQPLRALACETICRRAGRIPFTRNGVEITEDLIGITLECLNAEVTRTLPLKTITRETETRPGLAECLSERIGSYQGAAAPVIAEILINAGLAESAEVLDAATHMQFQGVRLLSTWSWHIGSGEFLTGGGQYTGGDDAWLARCPVCRTGILSRVTGKRLFGIPPTDYYLDCSHCGAKFIPEKDRFRLVSIARISDPRWRQYLSSCRTSDEWSALIREETPARQAPSRIATSRYRMAPKKPEAPPRTQPVRQPEKPVLPIEGVPVPFSTLRDGSLIVTGTTKTLYFRPASLRFLRGTRHDLFCHAERTLQHALENPAYAGVKPIFVREYAHYLSLRLGPVTEELRKKNDPRYRLLLNRYGAGEFGSFAMEDTEQAQKKGILIVFLKGKLCHIAACHTCFADLIDRTFGSITADLCYLDGDETSCRINSLVTAFREEHVFWIHELDDDRAIEPAVADLKDRYLKVSATSGDMAGSE
jgi:hypothetical protein